MGGLDYNPHDSPLGWSPAGDLLVSHLESYSKYDVFGASCSGSGIWRVPAGSGSPRPLAIGRPTCHAVQSHGGLTIDPTSRWLIYSASILPNNSRLVRLDLEAAKEDSLRTGCRVYHEHPAWSADGSYLVTQGLCEGRDANWALYLMRPDGSGLRRVGQSDSASRERPALSPDGNWIVFERRTGLVDGWLAVMDTLGRHYRVLVKGSDPAWSPDGQWIAYVADDADPKVRFTLRLIRPAGTGARLLFQSKEPSTFSRGWAPVPSGVPSAPLLWSPDSKWLLFRRSFDRGTTIWKVEIASGRIASVTHAVGNPAF